MSRGTAPPLHLLIGFSLVSGLLVRVSGYLAGPHMSLPYYIESHVNLIVDYHIAYATLTLWLVDANAGRVWP